MALAGLVLALTTSCATDAGETRAEGTRMDVPSRRFTFTYDAAVPAPPPTDGRKELTPSTRRELVRRSRYLAKNSGFTREMVADMAIYSTGDGIRPQAQSDDPDWNEAAEAYFKRWTNRPEITNRFSFEECQSLICRGVDVDGEYFVLKVRDRFGRARIQLVDYGFMRRLRGRHSLRCLRCSRVLSGGRG